jgi:hypothetical protein
MYRGTFQRVDEPFHQQSSNPSEPATISVLFSGFY